MCYQPQRHHEGKFLCQRNKRRIYFSVGSRKVSCMFLLRLLGKASPMAGGWKEAGFRWTRSGHPPLSAAMEPLWKLSDLTGIKREGLGPISSTLSVAEISILNDLSFFQKNSQGGKRTSQWRNTQRVTNSLPHNKLQILSTSFVTPGQGFLYFCYHWLDNNSKLSEF